MEELIDSLINLLEVRADRDKAFSDCDHSWGYFGAGREEELKKAKERFSEAFKKAVYENAPTHFRRHGECD